MLVQEWFAWICRKYKQRFSFVQIFQQLSATLQALLVYIGAHGAIWQPLGYYLGPEEMLLEVKLLQGVGRARRSRGAAAASGVRLVACVCARVRVCARIAQARP